MRCIRIIETSDNKTVYGEWEWHPESNETLDEIMAHFDEKFPERRHAYQVAEGAPVVTQLALFGE